MDEKLDLEVMVIELTSTHKFYEFILPLLIEWYRNKGSIPERRQIVRRALALLNKTESERFWIAGHGFISEANLTLLSGLIWNYYEEEVKASCNKEKKEDPYAELKEALKQGKRIQFKATKEGSWRTMNSRGLISWSEPIDQYRIHPDDVEKDQIKDLEVPETFAKSYDEWQKGNRRSAIVQQQPKKEETMKEIKVINKTFIKDHNGTETDVSGMTDEQMYACISSLEKEIDRLNAIKAKPKKLEAHIKTLEGQIADLVKLIDEKK